MGRLNPVRKSEIVRKTLETDISLSLCLDGSGESAIDTGCGFFDHMLTLLACHGRLDLSVKCVGDIQVDDHHSIEDIGICMGMALREALGDKSGIFRYGDAIIPMDEALVLAAVDVSGRSCLGFDLPIGQPKIGAFDTELIEEFFVALTRESGLTLHIKKLAGKNSHHIAEGAFKAFARALRQAVKIDENLNGKAASTKGVL